LVVSLPLIAKVGVLNVEDVATEAPTVRFERLNVIFLVLANWCAA
jgi:hypothetical protein